MWLLVCSGLTGLGSAASLAAGRRRGAGAGLRGVAWSLLPMVAYLTGVAGLLWKLGTAVSDWALGFVFSPKVWPCRAGRAGRVLFLVSGPLRRRAPAKSASTGKGGRWSRRPVCARCRPPRPKTRPKTRPKARPKPALVQASTRKFADVEEILRRRGIS